jgi:outer membrane protein assembly factor BamE (lipoprotein component of BamABCDE complex)
MLCGAAGLGWITGYLPMQFFNSARWKTPDTSYTRIRMLEALLLTHDLEKMTKSEVVDLLGQPPPTAYFSEWDFVYHLGPERGLLSIDSEWLVLRFGPDGRVSEWAVVSD